MAHLVPPFPIEAERVWRGCMAQLYEIKFSGFCGGGVCSPGAPAGHKHCINPPNRPPLSLPLAPLEMPTAADIAAATVTVQKMAAIAAAVLEEEHRVSFDEDAKALMIEAMVEEAILKTLPESAESESAESESAESESAESESPSPSKRQRLQSFR